MGYPIKRGTGGTEFVKIRNSAQYEIYDNGWNDERWVSVQADILVENRNGSPIINALETQAPAVRPAQWGFTVVNSGDFWFTVSLDHCNDDPNNQYSCRIDIGMAVNGSLVASTGFKDWRSREYTEWMMSAWSAELPGLLTGDIVTAQFRIEGPDEDQVVRPSLPFSFMALTRIGATP